MTVLVGFAEALLVFGTAGFPSSRDLARELTTLTNTDRRAHGLPALTPDERLNTIARERSEDMVVRGYFDHVIPPTGSSVLSILNNRRVDYEIAGENLGWTKYPAIGSAQIIEEEFMNSEHHRANILRPGYTAFGIGAVIGDSRVVYTILFLRPAHDDTAQASSRTMSTALKSSDVASISVPSARTLRGRW